MSTFWKDRRVLTAAASAIFIVAGAAVTLLVRMCPDADRSNVTHAFDSERVKEQTPKQTLWKGNGTRSKSSGTEKRTSPKE